MSLKRYGMETTILLKTSYKKDYKSNNNRLILHKPNLTVRYELIKLMKIKFTE